MTFEGRKITQDKGSSQKYNIEYIESRPDRGLSKSPDYINQGQNSGYQAINLAYNLGAKRIILLGYDMGATGKTHWFGYHPNKVQSNYEMFLRNYDSISKELPSLDLEIINCTRTTSLNCFPKMSLESVL